MADGIPRANFGDGDPTQAVTDVTFFGTCSSVSRVEENPTQLPQGKLEVNIGGGFLVQQPGMAYAPSTIDRCTDTGSCEVVQHPGAQQTPVFESTFNNLCSPLQDCYVDPPLPLSGIEESTQMGRWADPVPAHGDVLETGSYYGRHFGSDYLDLGESLTEPGHGYDTITAPSRYAAGVMQPIAPIWADTGMQPFDQNQGRGPGGLATNLTDGVSPFSPLYQFVNWYDEDIALAAQPHRHCAGTSSYTPRATNDTASTMPCDELFALSSDSRQPELFESMMTVQAPLVGSGKYLQQRPYGKPTVCTPPVPGSGDVHGALKSPAQYGPQLPHDGGASLGRPHPTAIDNNTSISPTRTQISSYESETLYCKHHGCVGAFRGRHRRGNLGRHNRQKHKEQGVAIYRCLVCKMSFARTDALLKHQRKKHPELRLEGPRSRRQ